ncbi:Bifunctional purine biosynthetic protein purD [Includes: Phosphoribosylamine--glycine ligase (Glycinamide ribonucleotide synthetase) (GARS) (Phosphoribosylglycinamide synthetase) [Durusdinium trenchii]|uniref:phosphoribosylamine--glycine ligase n=1 Tax=Durusdinium trenchii TaxID=1381693 RepID=A0ABP0RNA1_9DINO
MDVLVVGGGGREHAIAVKLRESPKERMTNLPIGDSDVAALVAAAEECKFMELEQLEPSGFSYEKKVALVFVGPEAPLCAGLADALNAKGVPCFGPSKLAAELEASKAFSKDFFAKYKLPTASYRTFKTGEHEAALKYVEEEYGAGRELVVKASGLAAGKGVLMPQSVEEAKEAVKEVMVNKVFGAAGDELVVEQLLVGEECSCMAFSDGQTAAMMVAAQDHKRVDDNDQGPNTGGMGAYAPAPCLTDDLKPFVKEVLQRTVEALAPEGRKYVGVLYGGFMLTKELIQTEGKQTCNEKLKTTISWEIYSLCTDGPMLLEYNCRFGDPETQVLLPLLDSDLFEIALGCAEGNLKARVPEVRWKPGAAATVVCAAKGYPGSYPKGLPITGIPEADAVEGVKVYHAGTKQDASGLASTGGGKTTILMQYG